MFTYWQLRWKGYCLILRSYFNIRWMSWLAHLLIFVFASISICKNANLFLQLQLFEDKYDCGLLTNSFWIAIFIFIVSPSEFLMTFVVWWSYRVWVSARRSEEPGQPETWFINLQTIDSNEYWNAIPGLCIAVPSQIELEGKMEAIILKAQVHVDFYKSVDSSSFDPINDSFDSHIGDLRWDPQKLNLSVKHPHREISMSFVSPS